jgi:hypothetical protein
MAEEPEDPGLGLHADERGTEEGSKPWHDRGSPHFLFLEFVVIRMICIYAEIRGYRPLIRS